MTLLAKQEKLKKALQKLHNIYNFRSGQFISCPVTLFFALFYAFYPKRLVVSTSIV